MANKAQELHPSATAVEKDDLVIPVRRVSRLSILAHFSSGTPSDKHAVALAITDAFKTSGFLFLKAHGIPPSVVSRVFASSSRFFARPQSQKDGLGWTTPQSNRGYVAIGREKLATLNETQEIDTRRESIPDLKETMEIGREGVDGLANQWPDHLDDEGKDFKETMISFFEMCKDLHKQIMRAIALGMNLPEHFFDEFVNEGDNNLRLLHYPAVRKQTFQNNPNQVRAGEHSDYGSVTLLFQDQHGGLQVRSPKGTFVDATPIADSIVVNAGDLLAHHETEGDSPDIYPARYSIAYFCNPNTNKVIEALPGTWGNDIQVTKKYSEITAGDYLVQRLTATM
ncbi:uncharacterized protein N7477_003682 [Penicillium maclennaniae]|uniref:uncharacterized protein n=1 Tax=Penicillium maclennaniae TaxID=1343394 RepID=UPI0025400090|nr:uncharacterized protein N7477_003682 [Penicillium maclennaniae]KAJ5678049.1 hypothetical protein N7477_003682 [Penicillium maclennaniae]